MQKTKKRRTYQSVARIEASSKPISPIMMAAADAAPQLLGVPDDVLLRIIEMACKKQVMVPPLTAEVHMSSVLCGASVVWSAMNVHNSGADPYMRPYDGCARFLYSPRCPFSHQQQPLPTSCPTSRYSTATAAETGSMSSSSCSCRTHAADSGTSSSAMASSGGTYASTPRSTSQTALTISCVFFCPTAVPSMGELGSLRAPVCLY